MAVIRWAWRSGKEETRSLPLTNVLPKNRDLKETENLVQLYPIPHRLNVLSRAFRLRTLVRVVMMVLTVVMMMGAGN